MRTFLATMLAATAVYAQHSRMSPQDQKALQGYDLSEAKMDKLMAVGKKMKAYAQAHPEVREQGDIMRGKTLDESVRNIEAKPELASMMKSEGVSPREFVLGMTSVMMGGTWAAMSKQYPDAKMPPEVNPKNVKFFQEHPEVMQKWEAAWSERGARGPRGAHGAPPAEQEEKGSEGK